MSWIFELFNNTNTTRIGRFSEVLRANLRTSLDMEEALHLELSYEDPLCEHISVGSYVRAVEYHRVTEYEIATVEGDTLLLNSDISDEMATHTTTLAVASADSDSVTVATNLVEHRYDRGFIEVTDGTGVGQKRTVGYNDTNTFYLMSSWNEAPDSSSTVAVRRNIELYIRRGDTWLGVSRAISTGVKSIQLSSLPTGYTHQEGDIVGVVAYRSFRVRKIVFRRENGVLLLTLDCEHDSYSLLERYLVSSDGRETLDYSTGVLPSVLLSRMEELSEWTVDWNELHDTTETRALSFSAENLRRVLNVIHEEWGCDIRFTEGKAIDLGTFGGKNRVKVKFRSNMLSLTKEIETKSNITTVWALGAEGDWINCATGILSNIYDATHSAESTTLELAAGEVEKYSVGDIVYVMVSSQQFLSDSTSTSTEIDYSSGSWSADEFAGGLLVLHSSSGKGEFRRVQTNTATRITVYDGFHSDTAEEVFEVSPRAYLCQVEQIYDSLNRIVVSWDKRPIPEDSTDIINGWVVACIRDTGSALTVGKHPAHRAYVHTVYSGSEFMVAADDAGKFSVGDWVFVGENQLSGVMRWVTNIDSGLTDTITLDSSVTGLAEGWVVEKRGVALVESSNPVLGKFEDSSIRDPYVLYEQAVEWGNKQRELSVRYTVQLVDLYGAFPRTYEDMDIRLGDYIHVVDSSLGIDDDLRIVRMTLNPIRPWETQIEISTIRETTDRRALERLKSLRNMHRRIVYADKLSRRRRCRNWKSGECLVRNKLTADGSGVYCYSTDSGRNGTSTSEGREITPNECPLYLPTYQNLNAEATEGVEEYVGLDSNDWTDIIAVDTGFLVKSAQIFLEGIYNPSTGYWLEEREYAEIRVKHQSDDPDLPVVPADSSTQYGFIIQARRSSGTDALTLYIRWVASGDRT